MTQGRTEIPYRCIGCGVSGVKLWREYQTFLDRQSLKCKACSEEEQARVDEPLGDLTARPKTDTIGWRVPAVPDGNGTFWGYTSVPQDRVDWWNALPEENLMDEEEESFVELTVELYDENGTIANVSLPKIQPEVTLTIYAKQKDRRRKLEVSLEVDDDGRPKFTILNPKDIA